KRFTSSGCGSTRRARTKNPFQNEACAARSVILKGVLSARRRSYIMLRSIWKPRVLQTSEADGAGLTGNQGSREAGPIVSLSRGQRTQLAPIPALSLGPPTRLVFPLAESATLKP